MHFFVLILLFLKTKDYRILFKRLFVLEGIKMMRRESDRLYKSSLDIVIYFDFIFSSSIWRWSWNTFQKTLIIIGFVCLYLNRSVWSFDVYLANQVWNVALNNKIDFLDRKLKSCLNTSYQNTYFWFLWLYCYGSVSC